MPSRAKLILDNLAKKYELLKKQTSHNALGADTAEALIDVVQYSLKFLSQCNQIPLNSSVPGKDYFAFAAKKKGGKISRAVNKNLFAPDTAKKLEKVLSKTLSDLPLAER